MNIDPKKVGALVRKSSAVMRAAAAKGMIRGAMRSRAHLQRITPKDTGQAKASWRIQRSGLTSGARTLRNDGEHIVAEWINDAPQTVILENGARPHGMSPEGFKNLYRWVERHKMYFDLGPVVENVTPGPYAGTDPRINGIVYGIMRRLREEGQKPLHFVKQFLPEAERIVDREVAVTVKAAMDDIGKAGQ